MSGVLRCGTLIRLVSSSTKPTNAKCLLKQNLPAIQQVCEVSGKAMRGGLEKWVRPSPYPYKTKNYTYLNAIFDRTTYRFDENSKIIVVEGPMAAGKSKFAKDLADDLDMLYVPEANMDLLYINPYGFDMRKLDDQLPESSKSFDISNFCKNPFHKLSAAYQLRMYNLRYAQYVDALAHLLSTGQGVVLDRSCFSDFVFTEAMERSGYISKGARSAYNDIKKNTITELIKPHLVIYLDISVDEVKKRVKARNIDYEVNSKIMNDKYLNDIDYFYKQHYLKEISVYSELLVYDWSNGGEAEIVVEDIERIDFNRFAKHDKKLKEWRLPREWDWCELRMKYTDDKPDLMNFFNVPRFDVPELIRTAEDAKAWRDVWYNAPGMEYAYGYNSKMGDKNVLLKTNYPASYNDAKIGG